MQTLNTKQLKDMRNKNEDFLLINTLDEDDFGSTQIPGAINIPQSQDDFVQKVDATAESKDQKIVTYCASEECQSSTKAAKKLEQAGFSKVYDFEAGAKGWQESGENLVVA